MVFNKMDQLDDGSGGALNRLQEKFPHAVAISATTGEGIPALLAEIGTQLRPKREFLELRIPHEQSAVIARLHKVGQVIERRYNGKRRGSRRASRRITTTNSRRSLSKAE